MSLSPQKSEVTVTNFWQSIYRIILDELAPHIRQMPLELLKQVMQTVLVPPMRGNALQKMEVRLKFERELVQDEREYYVLAEIIVLISQVLLQARGCGQIEADILKPLEPSTLMILTQLLERIKAITQFPHEENDVLGRIFQTLLPPTTRKKLAAFYTKPVISKFVVRFVVEKPQGILLDPACGTGAFLTAAFERFQCLNPMAGLRNIASNLKGIEINPITRLCAETNLNLRFGCFPSCPVLIHQGNAFSQFTTPSDKVDFLTTNPPFTRGERLSSTYKAFLRSFFSEQFSPVGEVKNQFCSKNMPLHGYFLLDMDRFLGPGGRFGVVLPASTLHLAGLRGVRKYLLAHYILEFVITSEVETFSEDSDLKEIIVIGHLREGNDTLEGETTFATIITPIGTHNFSEFTDFLASFNQKHESGEEILVHKVKKAAMQEEIADWTVFFPVVTNSEFADSLLLNGKIGRVCDLEGDSVEIFRGFRQDFASYWAVPNAYWVLLESRPDCITIQNVQKSELQIPLPVKTWYEGLSRPEFYFRPLIENPQFFILKGFQSPKQEKGLAQYCTWVRQQLSKDQSNYTKFLQQLRQVGTHFTFTGRIAFCHRIDVTTSKIMCYLSLKSVQLNQNWFSIRGLDPLAEELLVAWFNSTLFITTYLQRRRTQRGPYGQTAVREFRQYMVCLPEKFNSGEINRIIDQFRVFNNSQELDFPLSEQISRSLTQETTRKNLDLVFLDALQIFPSHKDRQRKFLEQIYRVLVDKIEQIRLQGRRSGL